MLINEHIATLYTCLDMFLQPQCNVGEQDREQQIIARNGDCGYDDSGKLCRVSFMVPKWIHPAPPAAADSVV